MEEANRLPFRQIHLDFHTHESIEGIGADFDPDEFADTLVKAHVNSINLFARGHHGWIYYDTKAHPDHKHPELTRNLLKDQIEACHKRGIKTPIYVTVQWDAVTVDEHPEWCCRNEHGGANNYYAPGFYTCLCLNTPYVDFLKEHVTDIFECVPVDGFWFDIVSKRNCSCTYCRTGMLEQGLDPSDPAVRDQYASGVLARFKKTMTEHVRAIDPTALIFYNAGHVNPLIRESIDQYTHLELESLPFRWGYSHFPTSVRYARTLGKQLVGMTGKFHTTWGDFHSFKNREALEFECFSMLAQGATCCVGDQLHPRGKICPHTYDRIGDVYKQVEAREPWCEGATAQTDIAVFSPEEFTRTGGGTQLPRSIKGAVHMLQELRMQFDIIDTHHDVSAYQVLVLPDQIPVDDRLAERLTDFVGAGGRIVASHESGLTLDGRGFAIDMGVEYLGKDEYEVPFVRPRAGFGADLHATEYAAYDRSVRKGKEERMQGSRVQSVPGAEILADMVAPYFNRTWEHFCSHRHAPTTGKVYGPAVTYTQSAAYIAQPIFALYGDCAPQWTRQVLEGVLDRLLPDPLIRVENAPRSLVVSVMCQEHKARTLVHLLNYIPRRNNQNCEIIEDIIPLHNVTVHLRCDRPVSRIRCVPEDQDVACEVKDGVATFVLPCVGGYQIVEVS